jgi:hypothetical protein
MVRTFSENKFVAVDTSRALNIYFEVLLGNHLPAGSCFTQETLFTILSTGSEVAHQLEYAEDCRFTSAVTAHQQLQRMRTEFKIDKTLVVVAIHSRQHAAIVDKARVLLPGYVL